MSFQVCDSEPRAILQGDDPLYQAQFAQSPARDPQAIQEKMLQVMQRYQGKAHRTPVERRALEAIHSLNSQLTQEQSAIVLNNLWTDNKEWFAQQNVCTPYRIFEYADAWHSVYGNG